MNEEHKPNAANDETTFSRAGRRAGGAQAQGSATSHAGVWFGLGMMGLIGWSVVVPTLLGAALGIWLDKRHPGSIPGRWRCWSPGSARLFQCVALGRQGRQGDAGGSR